MSEEEPPFSKQDQLALAFAQGKSFHGLARQNDRWADDSDCHRQVEDWRRPSSDRGHMRQSCRGRILSSGWDSAGVS
jgi:hypothetical protein